MEVKEPNVAEKMGILVCCLLSFNFNSTKLRSLPPQHSFGLDWSLDGYERYIDRLQWNITWICSKCHFLHHQSFMLPLLPGNL